MSISAHARYGGRRARDASAAALFGPVEYKPRRGGELRRELRPQQTTAGTDGSACSEALAPETENPADSPGFLGGATQI